MRTEELVSKIYEASEKLSEILSYEFRGKTVAGWLGVLIQYSFVIWLGLGAWKGYQYYLEFSKLKQQLDRKERTLKNAQSRYSYLKRRIEDINTAYNSVSNIFSRSSVALLKRKINRAFKELNKQEFIVSPVKYGGFNYQFRLGYKFFSSVKGVSLPDFSFRSDITERFKSSLNNELHKMWQNRERTVWGTVELTLRGNRILMYFDRKGRSLKLVPKSYVGFVKSIYQTEGFLQASFVPYEALKNNLSYSFALIGWDFSLR